MADVSFDDLIPKGGGLTFDDLITSKPKGYQGAKKRLADQARLRRENNTRFAGEAVGGALNALDDFTGQVARNTGASDEIAGGINYVLQGGENLVRRATGQPIEVPAATAARAAVDFDREQQRRYQREHPGRDFAASGAAIFASGMPANALAVPAVGARAAGGNALALSPLKAGAAAATLNAPFAVARQEGSLRERLPGAAVETAVAFGAGAGLQAAGNALAGKAAKVRTAPKSPQRQISAEGVDLTPGQMLGGAAQRTEDALTSIPVLGDSIRGARIRGIESFDKAALNRALAPISMKMPDDVPAGREGVKFATGAISKAYDDALQGVRVAPDAPFAAEIDEIINKATLPTPIREELRAINENTIKDRFSAEIPGKTWKMIDADMEAMIRAAEAAAESRPSQAYLRDGLIDMRNALVGALARANPAAANSVHMADTAFANLVRIRKAAQYTGTSAREGLFSPSDLNRAVQSSDGSVGNRDFGMGNALMQDLTDPAMRVLPQQVPDSGTPIRSLITAGGLSGLGTQAGIPLETVAAAGLGVAGGAGLYSKPVVGLLNVIYRATEPGQASEALAQLAALAGKNPELQQVYREAMEHFGLAKRPTPVGPGEQ